MGQLAEFFETDIKVKQIVLSGAEQPLRKGRQPCLCQMSENARLFFLAEFAQQRCDRCFTVFHTSAEKLQLAFVVAQGIAFIGHQVVAVCGAGDRNDCFGNTVNGHVVILPYEICHGDQAAH